MVESRGFDILLVRTSGKALAANSCPAVSHEREILRS